MMTLVNCPLKQTYFVSEIKGDSDSKKHLQNLGLVKNARVAIMNRDKNNGVVLIHNSRVALDNAILANISVAKELIGHENMAQLSAVKPGQTAMVLRISVDETAKPSEAALKRRLLDMGVTRGTRIYVRKVAPLGDPMELHVRGYELTLRKNEAEKVEVSVLDND
ncbi:ferrous iron transporter A [Lactococcus hodotermopsidis]|uniref:Ferrous iron transporter A n=1 Tax=Pseudolactococcus hodotermopsidis TaxID=2709157 RepID=A0A6A0BC23_9LACT|nr:ferrous iron transport protein A [Lactococcus hodotermopsidis]GFH42205.1 ferrous iron transporter A [Lactococcus hodotermopsidis]